MTAPGEAVSLVVQNLRPGTRYRFKVFAENRHGLGVESQTVTARTTDEGKIRRLFVLINLLPWRTGNNSVYCKKKFVLLSRPGK